MDETGQDSTSQSPQLAIERVATAAATMRSQLHRVIVGQDEVIEQMLISLFAQGHSIFIGVPGLAKTLLVDGTEQGQKAYQRCMLQTYGTCWSLLGVPHDMSMASVSKWLQWRHK